MQGPMDYSSNLNSPFLSGANTALGLVQAKQQTEDRQAAQQAQKDLQTVKGEFMSAYQNNDINKLVELSIMNPEIGDQVNKAIGYRSAQTKEIMANTLGNLLTAPPEQRSSIINAGISAIEKAGGNPENLRRALDEDPEIVRNSAIVTLGGLGDTGKGYLEAYKMTRQGDVPEYSNVNFDKAGNPFGINKSTGQYEPIQGGFQRAKPTPQTVVNMGKAESEQAKTIAKAEGENYNAYVNDAKVARTNDATLNRLENLNEKAFDGITAPAYKAASKIASSLGVNVEGLTETELFDALANELVLGKTSQMTGTLTDSDMQFLISTVPQLSQTKEGRKQLIGIMKEMNNAVKDKARLAAKFRKENGGQFDDMAFQDWLETQPKKDRFSKFASSEPTQPVIQAPQGALDYLKANPSMANQFKAKYGYLPEGY